MATPELRSCKLCQTQKQLCDSHIIPEFLYKPLYSDNHKCVGVRPDGSYNKLQKGLREVLLCADCEGQISGYEKYSSEFLCSLSKENFPAEAITINGIDYRKFKLFLLSILWRTSISTLPIFNAVSLGPHEENIRRMIKNGDPGGENDYPCMVYFFKDEQNLSRSIYAPDEIRLEGHRCFKFLLTRFLFIYFVSNHRKPVATQIMSLKEDGSLPIMLLDEKDYKEMPEYRKAIDILKRRLKP